MLDAYDATLKARGFKSDPAQRAAAQRLQGLYAELVAFKAARKGTLRKLLSRPKQPRSVYFWGGVGRGKSFLMDCFYDSVPYQRKRRVHFHAFMQEVQNDLKTLNNEADPLQKVADRIARQTRLLCFDEFHVSDIADAMILGRLLDALFARGTVFVMTSNYPPDGLYPNGLQRINFLPTIDMIKRRFDVVEVDHGTDYRLRTLEQMDAFLVPGDDAARPVHGPAQTAVRRPEIDLQPRRLAAHVQSDGLIHAGLAPCACAPRYCGRAIVTERPTAHTPGTRSPPLRVISSPGVEPAAHARPPASFDPHRRPVRLARPRGQYGMAARSRVG